MEWRFMADSPDWGSLLLYCNVKEQGEYSCCQIDILYIYSVYKDLFALMYDFDLLRPQVKLSTQAGTFNVQFMLYSCPCDLSAL